MAKFSLTAQIGLQAPTNTKQVVSQIQNALKGVSVNVNINANARQLAQVSNQLNSVNQSAKAANTSVSELGKTIGAAARRFGAISLVTGTFLGLSRSIKNSLGDAIEFERQMVILAQVTEKSVKQLNDLYSEVTRLATGFGVSSESLLKTSIILAQAGLEARKTKGALEVLAKTQLAASFDDITSTTEGAIAILAQFRREAAAAGGEIVFLERSLEAINQVSKKYAVESSDLVAVIRRSGGAFEAAGGSLNELLALFTSVRATTRESAETISTGLRTIFTRIQRVDTIRQLKDLGIELQDLEGKFVGPFEAIKRISEGLSSLDPRDFRFAQIVEELGGFRQISKVIPLIKQFGLAQEALNTAQSASGSLTQDAATAQQSLANQLTKVNEEFQALIRKFTDSEAFHSVAGGALEFARALIRIADAIEPLLPMIASLAAFNVGRGFVSALGAFTGFGGQRRNNGGKIHAFATGGMVPGSGNRDTVPAMLTPGEFVIRKASVKKFGAQNLAKLNGGGVAEAPQPSFGGVGIFDSDMITGGTNVKKDLLSKIKASQKPYEVIAGPAGSGKSTLATTKFGKNFVFSDADIEKYSKFVVLSGASKTKSGDFSDDVQNLLTSASKISVLAPDEERLTKQRQIRFESSLAGNLLDQRSSDALRGTLKAPMGANEDLFKKYKNVEILRQYSSGTGARGVEPRRLATEAPLVDDLPNTKDAMKPRPGISSGSPLSEILRTGHGALDFDRTLQRTVGDQAYANAKDDKQRQAVLQKYFRDPAARLRDAKSAKLTQFGQELQGLIKAGQIDPRKLTLISKSSRTPGLPEHVKSLFGIPIENMIFTSGGSKQPALDAFRQKGPRIDRIQRKAIGGVVQRLNDGGELKTKDHVGALFLEPASKIQDTETVSVSKKDVLAAEPSFDSRRYFHGFDETKKDEKTYTIHKSGLKDDKSSNYSEIFNNILNEGIKNAVNTVVTQVAGSLNIDKPEVTRDANTYAKYINKGARGILFEEAIAQLSRQGGGDPYDNRADTQAPFDFVGSIGNAAGLFKNGLATTAKYKDAKASYSAKVIESIQNKIARQISRESLSSFIYEKNNRFDQELIKGDDDKGDGSWSKKKLIDYLRKNDTNIIGMQAPPDTVRNRLEILGFKENQDYEVTGGKTGGYSYRFKSREQEPELVKKAIGGGVGGTDTVPALLTPGEFVIKRKSAQRIGYGKLHRLNKTGSVHGYANGGVVGMNDGGFVGMKTGGDQKSAKERYKAQQSAKRRQERMVKEGIAGQDEQFVQTYFESQHAQGSLRRIPKVRGAGGKSEEMMGRTPGTITAGTGRALGTNKLSLDAIRGLGEIANKLSLTYEQGVVLEKKYLQLRRKGLGHEEALQKATERATKLTLERNKNFDKKEEPGKKPDKQGRAIDIEAFQKLASSAQQFIFLGSSVAAVATQFSALDAATSRAITETIAFGSTMVGLAGTVSDLFISLGKAVVGTAAETTAKGAETMASWGVTASLLPFATIAIAVVAALALLAGGLYFMKARAKAVSEEYSKQAKQIADDIESGKRSTAEKESFVQKERAAAESLADSYWFLWGAKKREADAAEAAARSYINIIAAIADFDKAISAIDADKSLTPAQKAGKKLEAFGKASSEASDDILSAAKQRSAIAASVGKDIASVTKSDLASEGQFKEFERLGEAVDKGSELLKSSFTRISAELQVGLEDAMSKTDFSKAATDINLDGVVDSFDAVLEQNSAFAQSLNDQTNRIRTNAETLAQLQREAGNFVGALATTKEAESQIANLNKSYQAQAMATAKAQAGAIALAKTMRDTAKTGFIASKMSDYFVGVMDGLTKFEKDLNLISSVMNNEFANFELPEIKGLDDISQVKNLKKFNAQVTQVGSVLGETGKDIADQVIAVADVFKRSNDILNKNFNTIGQGEMVSAGNDARDAIDAVLEPLKRFDALKDLMADAKSALLEASAGGEGQSKITASEREKALGPLKEFTDRYADLLKQINETQIAQLKQYSSYATQLAAAQQKEVAFREGFVNIQERGAQRFAEATGNPLTTQQKEGFRTAKVSARLGNAQVLGDALKKLNNELLKAQGADADADSIAKNRKLTLQAQETTKALEDMADQSDKAADVLSDIAKERAKREVASKMLESFVVGGPEERMQMMQTSAGLQAAQQAGTLQILPPEIRKSVTSMLDELSFGDPTSEAAKLKKNLVLNDAVRMGLVSQGQAQQIAEATPLEQKLQQDLINITNEENLALEALRQANLSNKDALQQNTDALYANIANEKTLAQQKVEEAKKEFDTRRQAEKEKNEKINAAKDAAKQNVDLIDTKIKENEKKKTVVNEDVEKIQTDYDALLKEIETVKNQKRKDSGYDPSGRAVDAFNQDKARRVAVLEKKRQNMFQLVLNARKNVNNIETEEKSLKNQRDDAVKKLKAAQENIEPVTAENKSQAANFATGGTVSGKGGRDSIPAMLTDGEFVINKQSAQKIGYDNLNRLNNTGSILGYFNGGAASPDYPSDERIDKLIADQKEANQLPPPSKKAINRIFETSAVSNFMDDKGIDPFEDARKKQEEETSRKKQEVAGKVRAQEGLKYKRLLDILEEEKQPTTPTIAGTQLQQSKTISFKERLRKNVAESARQKTQAQQAKTDDFAARRHNINEGTDPVEDKEKAIQAIDREEKLSNMTFKQRREFRAQEKIQKAQASKQQTIRDQSPSAQRKQAIEAQRQQLRQRFESQRNLPAEDRQKLIQQNAIRIERERLMRQGYNVPPILTNFANPQQNPFVPQNATAPTTRNAQGPYVPPQAAPMAAQSAAVASRPTPGTNPVITLDQGAQDILKNIPAAFNGFADRMQKITNTLNGLTVNHTLNVKGSLNINSTEVANAVTKALGEYIGNEINRILKNKDNGNPEPPTR